MTTAVLLHAAARGEEARAFADTALRQALPALVRIDFFIVLIGQLGVGNCHLALQRLQRPAPYCLFPLPAGQ